MGEPSVNPKTWETAIIYDNYDLPAALPALFLTTWVVTESNMFLQEREERDGGVDAGHVRLRPHPEAPSPPRARACDARVGAPVGGDGGQAEHAELGEAEEQGGEEGLGQEDPRIQLAEVGHRESRSMYRDEI